MGRFTIRMQLALLTVLLSPAFTWAQGNVPEADPSKNNRIGSQTDLTSLQAVAEGLFKVLIVFLPGVATLYLILSGYRYIVAQGNPDMVEKAKKSLTYAVFGVVLAYSSVLVMLIVGRQLGITTGFQ